TDITARYGGDEFCLALINIKAPEARDLAEKLRAAVADRVFSADDGTTFHITCSIGLAQHRKGMEDSMTILKLADHALYEAKSAGRNRVKEKT
ncbi:MAG: GGDEF domain-containing protein, partial [Thermoplasmatales archaeon]|nr:GGDEF domain-containing protein [Thermoplasmatales archaeon]